MAMAVVFARNPMATKQINSGCGIVCCYATLSFVSTSQEGPHEPMKEDLGFIQRGRGADRAECKLRSRRI